MINIFLNIIFIILLNNISCNIINNKLKFLSNNKNNLIQNIQNNNEKIGIILLNLGGPEKQEDVQGFLYNLFADPDIIRLPKFPCPLSALQKPIAYFISKNRAEKSKAGYQRIGGGSPINMYTREQAYEIEKSLSNKGYPSIKCYIGMRYWLPYTTEAIKEAKKDGITHLVVLPLYPHYSISTSGSSLKELKEILDRKDAPQFQHTVIPYWYERPGYLEAMARLIANKYESFSEQEKKEGVHILFSAHGVPISYIKSGDPYKTHIENCTKLISEQLQKILDNELLTSSNQPIKVILPDDNITSIQSLSQSNKVIKSHLSFQSRVGPVEWLRPYTDHKIEEMGAEGVKNLIVVPISFVSEHIETLDEIDIEYKKLALESGIQHWERAAALNTDPIFINDISDLIIETLKSPPVTLDDVLSTIQPNLAKKSKISTFVSSLFRRKYKGIPLTCYGATVAGIAACAKLGLK